MRFVLFFQKSLIVLTCVFAAASAKWGYSYNIPCGYVRVTAGRDKFRNIAKLGVQAANIAAEVLNTLARDLPAVLRSVDPAIKSDIAKVDEIVGKVCDEIMFQAVPSVRDFQYFTPESILKTCEYIREVSADMVRGLDDPAIYQSYVDEMNVALEKLEKYVAWNY